MNAYFGVAAGLVFLLGVVHSVLGELLIFHRLREGSLISSSVSPILRERDVRILSATWHALTVSGWGFGAILLRLSFSSSQYTVQAFVESTILFSMLSASLIVLIGTKGKHPGWLVLLVIAISLWIG